jgi:hypothetical protein
MAVFSPSDDGVIQIAADHSAIVVDRSAIVVDRSAVQRSAPLRNNPQTLNNPSVLDPGAIHDYATIIASRTPTIALSSRVLRL